MCAGARWLGGVGGTRNAPPNALSAQPPTPSVPAYSDTSTPKICRALSAPDPNAVRRGHDNSSSISRHDHDERMGLVSRARESADPNRVDALREMPEKGRLHRPAQVFRSPWTGHLMVAALLKSNPDSQRDARADYRCACSVTRPILRRADGAIVERGTEGETNGHRPAPRTT